MSISAISGSLSYQMLTRNVSKNGDEEAEDKFAELDLDGDGGISLEESGLSEEEFTSMDVDGDGLLTEMDRQAHLIELMQKSQQEEPLDLSSLMAEMDADGDGYVTEPELAEHLAKMEEQGMSSPLSASELLAEMDADGDGMVSEAELEIHLAGIQQSAQMMPSPPPSSSEEEEDEDGQLGLGAAGSSSEEFDVLDTNEDGVVSQAELEAANIGGGETKDTASAEEGSLTGLALSAYLAMNSTYLANDGYQSMDLFA